jgi:hypothetical protein
MPICSFTGGGGGGGGGSGTGVRWFSTLPFGRDPEEENAHHGAPDWFVKQMEEEEEEQYSISHFEPNHGQPQHLDGPISFSMYNSDVYAGADIFSERNSGYRTSDTSGAIAPGSQAPGFNTSGGGGGFTGKYDASRSLGFSGNDRLLFGLNFDYQRENTSYGTSVLTPGMASAGSLRADVYSLTGAVAYSIDRFHASGTVSYDWTYTAITNNLDGGTGSTTGQGYGLDAAAGYTLPLLNTTGVTRSVIPTKAIPPAVYSGYAMFLDLSGHVSYADNWNNGYTDSSATTFGTERASFTDLGVNANFTTVIPRASFSWMPYLGVSLDHEFGFSHTLDIPATAVTPADTIFFSEATTFWTVKAGSISSTAKASRLVSMFTIAPAQTLISSAAMYFLKSHSIRRPLATVASTRQASSLTYSALRTSLRS